MRAWLIATAAAQMGDWCEGNQMVYDSCNQQLCAEELPQHAPVDAEFGEWNEWGECSCQFLKERSRPVKQHHQYNGAPISGTIIEAAECQPDLVACNIQAPVDCAIGEWGAWNADCECGRTQVFRERTIDTDVENCGKTCDNLPLNETKACPQVDCTEPVDCKLTKWSDWDKCTVSCGGGQQQHTRYVETYPTNGGAECEDVLIETRGCNEDCCDDKLPVDCVWGGWSKWSACSAECDGGERTRQRMLQTPPRHGGAWCEAGSIREVEGCGEAPCNPESPVNGKWKEWGEWGQCSETCDGGFQWRSRGVAVAAAHGGTPATGEFQEFRTCNEVVCELPGKQDCEFGAWTGWGGCSMACNGFQQRSREITQHAKEGGAICEGALRMIEPCNVDSETCRLKSPKPCEWAEWENWSSCSTTCGGGTSARERAIRKDAQYSGEGCEGEVKNIRSCATESCNPELDKDVDCQWNEWSEWGACTQSCGGGQKERWRHVHLPAKNDGAICTAQDSLEVSPCNLEGCGVKTFCSWAEWKPWSECSAECGGGEKSRARALFTSADRPEGEALATSRFVAMGMALGSSPMLAVGAGVSGALVGLMAIVVHGAVSRRSRASQFDDGAHQPLVEQVEMVE